MDDISLDMRILGIEDDRMILAAFLSNINITNELSGSRAQG